MIPSLPESPARKENDEEDEAQFGDYPWVEPPIRLDYGTRVSCVSPPKRKSLFLTFFPILIFRPLFCLYPFP
jgi:hypothetical protein